VRFTARNENQHAGGILEALMKAKIWRLFGAAIVSAGVTGAVLVVAAEEDQAARTPEAVQAAEVAKALADMSLVATGQRSFIKCQACHMVGEKAQRRVGPPLNGVVGRAAGTAEEFGYSPGMQKVAAVDLVWTVEALDAYMAAPREIVPGTSMGFAGIPKPEERKALVAYLASFKADGSRIEEPPE